MMNIRTAILTVALMAGATSTAGAQGLGDILKGLGNGGGDLGSTISNVIQGVFTKSDLTLDDLVGEYVSTGPAVTFKSDNFLEKAGGIAGAAAIETKLQPYYEQYGMIGMPLTIDKDANFTMSVKRIKLSGTVERNDGDGTFTFNLLMGGKMKIGQFTAYVEKSGSNLNLMFDATKLKEIVSMVAKFSGSTLAKTMGTILDSYEGACVGFKMQSTGTGAATTGSGESTGISTDSTNNTATPESGLNSLKNLLNKKKK